MSRFPSPGLLTPRSFTAIWWNYLFCTKMTQRSVHSVMTCDKLNVYRLKHNCHCLNCTGSVPLWPFYEELLYFQRVGRSSISKDVIVTFECSKKMRCVCFFPLLIISGWFCWELLLFQLLFVLHFEFRSVQYLILMQRFWIFVQCRLGKSFFLFQKPKVELVLLSSGWSNFKKHWLVPDWLFWGGCSPTGCK